MRSLGGSGISGIALRWNEKRAKTIEQDINEKGSQPRFHSGAMITQVDYKNQLIDYSILFLGFTSTSVLGSLHDHGATTAGRACIAGLGAG